jgi:DNA-binding NtrC family response regulator
MADSKPVLLVVDDEPGIIALVERFAAGKGFTVISRTDGRGIVAELPAIKADVALVDLRLPGMSGLELLRAMQHADPSLSVIPMTGHASVDSAIEAVKLGALDYLSKPLDFDRLNELFGTVREGLDRRRRLLTADKARWRAALNSAAWSAAAPSCRSSSTRFAGWRLTYARLSSRVKPEQGRSSSHVRFTRWARAGIAAS